jgi:hypothetical protein
MDIIKDLLELVDENPDQANEFWLKVGDRVAWKPDPVVLGTVKSVDLDCYPLEKYGITTANIEWDDCAGSIDIQWTNKLEKVEN